MLNNIQEIENYQLGQDIVLLQTLFGRVFRCTNIICCGRTIVDQKYVASQGEVKGHIMADWKNVLIT